MSSSATASPIPNAHPNLSAAETLRHMSSQSALPRSPRHSIYSPNSPKLLNSTLSPSYTPSHSSIPSSPTSVHSSSSAIFERDIEVLPSAISPTSPPHAGHYSSHNAPNSNTYAPPDPHRTSRAKATEHIDSSVPSVLDSAAAILATLDVDSGPGEAGSTSVIDGIAVVTPASTAGYANSFGGHASGWTSPIGSIGGFRSRSPSPGPSSNPHSVGLGGSVGSGRNSLLLSIPIPHQHSQQQQQQHVMTPMPNASSTSPSPPSSGGLSGGLDGGGLTARPTIATTTTGLSTHSHSTGLITPTSAYYSLSGSASASSSSLSASVEGSGEGESPTTTTRVTAPLLPSPPLSNPQSPNHNPNPNANKRLSFLSYTDLLTSAPTSTLPLSSLTTGALDAQPPPHVFGNHPHPSGSSSGPLSPQGSLIESVLEAGSPVSPNTPLRRGSGGAVEKRHSLLLALATERGAAALDEGGEWERSGLGRGLEERLESLEFQA